MTAGSLLSAAAVRSAVQRMLDRAAEEKLGHWHLDLGLLRQIAVLVADVTRRNYPDLDIPFHSRWRHFTAGAWTAGGPCPQALGDADEFELAQHDFDLLLRRC